MHGTRAALQTFVIAMTKEKLGQLLLQLLVLTTILSTSMALGSQQEAKAFIDLKIMEKLG